MWTTYKSRNSHRRQRGEQMDISRKTVCFVTSTLQGGGAQRVLVNIANRFAQDGWQTHLICFVSQNIPALFSVDPAIHLHHLPRGYTIKDKLMPRCTAMLRALLQEISPDVVIPFLMPTTAYTFRAAKKLGIKIIVSERNDPVRTPVDPYWRRLRDHIFKHADGCVFQTENAFSYFGDTVKRHAIIRNPINLAGTRTDRITAAERENRVVCVGKYEPQKNLDFLLEVFNEFSKTHPQYILEVYGNDYHRRRLPLQQRAAALGIADKVYLHEARPDIFDVIYNARMCVLPSKYEGMPNALIESVSLGVPSIASDCPAYGGREIVRNGENGFLLPVNDHTAFVNAMCRLADDDALADTFTQEGKKTAELFSIDRIYPQWKALVLDILKA